jgi:hypothetical protein
LQRKKLKKRPCFLGEGGNKEKRRSCSRKTKTVGVLEERRKEEELKEDSDSLFFPSVGNGF